MQYVELDTQDLRLQGAFLSERLKSVSQGQLLGKRLCGPLPHAS